MEKSYEYMTRVVTHILDSYKEGKETIHQALAAMEAAVSVYMLMLRAEERASKKEKRTNNNKK